MSSNLRSVEGMAFDHISKILYFVDGFRKTIELVRVSNSIVKFQIFFGKMVLFCIAELTKKFYNLFWKSNKLFYSHNCVFYK